MKEMQNILSSLRQAVDKYEMIGEGDVIAVGLSGGKDSTALLAALHRMSMFYPRKFRVIGLRVDLGFEGGDFSSLEEFCSESGIDYFVEKTEIKRIVFDERREKNPCSLCSKLRRGAIVDAAIRLGANKIALGHHLDDAAETFFMNLVNSGKLGCYSPVTAYDDCGIVVIRPFIYTREADIASLVKKTQLPVISSPCPEDGKTDREELKSAIRLIEKENKGLKRKIIGAMESREIDGWK